MIELKALGPLGLRDGDGADVDAVLAQPKRAAVLVSLAAAGRNTYLRRDPLLGMFWPDQPETRARGALRQTLYALKKDLGNDLLFTRGDDEIAVDPDVLWCDVCAFDEAVNADDLERAVQCYRGPFLSGFFLKGNVEFEQWVDGQRERLARAHGEALETLAQRAAEAGDPERAVAWLRRLAEHNPYNSRIALEYMEALAASGDRAGALRHAARLAARVQQDLDAAPSPDVTALAQRLRKDPVARNPTRFIRVRPTKPPDNLDALREALAGRYTVEREVGSGGMATVYLAEDTKHHRQVAIKVLKPELAAVLGAERFTREIEIAAQLNHPHVLAVHDSGQAGRFLYYVTPFAGGESLRDRLNREKQLPIDDAVAIASQVASALDYAHRQQIIHRDIKPENILLQDGQALVADFGIALALQAVQVKRLTESGLSLGTPHYMSPEQAVGDRAVDGRSDIYSLGCVLYEMLAGEAPHTGPTAQAILAKIATDEPRGVSELRKTVPHQMHRAVHKALAKLPADRFAQASAFADALSGTPGLDVPGQPKISLIRPALVALAGVVVLSLGVLLGAMIKSSERPQASSVVRFQLPLTGVDLLPLRGVMNWGAGGGQLSIGVAPDGSGLTFVGVDSLGTSLLYVRPFDAISAVPMPGTENARNPFYSPDGQSIGFVQGNRLRRVSIAGGAIETVSSVRFFQGASWGPGDQIVFSDDAGIFLVSAAGGEPELIAAPDSSRIAGRDVRYHRPHLLPDGKTVLFHRWSVEENSGTLAALSLDDREVTLLEQEGESPQYVDGGFVVFAQPGGALVAVPFDVERKRFLAQPRPIAEGAHRREFGVSRAGAVAYLGESPLSTELVMVDRQGGARPLVGATGHHFRHPRFSPGNGRLIVVRGVLPGANAGDVYTYDTVRRTLTRITSDSTSQFPEWSPDGRHIIYAGLNGDDWDLLRVPIDGSRPPEVLLNRPNAQWQGQITPDGRELVFWEYDLHTLQDIFVTLLDDPTIVRPLAQTASAEQDAALSPDGRWIAYRSNETGTNEVYIRGMAPGSGKRLVSVGGGHAPRWEPTGSDLYYLRADSLFVVSLGAGTEDIGSPQAMFHAPFVTGRAKADYDVHPNGREFVFVRRTGDARGPSIHVVLNWFDGLRGSEGN